MAGLSLGVAVNLGVTRATYREPFLARVASVEILGLVGVPLVAAGIFWLLLRF